MGTAEVLPPGTSDESAVESALGSPAEVLLVPFHGHRDEAGNAVDGLHFLQALFAAQGGRMRQRVIMPYTAFAAAAIELANLDPALEAAIHFLDTGALDDPELVHRLRAHIHTIPVHA